MATTYDCIVIGGGHNGLVCAAYLTRGGKKTLVLEAADQVGGAAITRAFAPGFQVSSCAHLLHMMPATIVRDLNLASHGLKFAASSMPSWALDPDGPALEMGRVDLGADAFAYRAFIRKLSTFSKSLLPILNMVPPRLGTTSWSDRAALLRMGWNIRKLGRTDMRELLRIIGMNVYDLLEDSFRSRLLQGAVGFDAVLGTNFGPRSPGTVLALLTRMAAQSGAGSTKMAQPQGGMGAITASIASAACDKGAEIRTGARVSQILVESDSAVGVVLANGEEIRSGSVISNADPKTTFLNLLGARHLDTGFVRRTEHIRSSGVAAKLHLALDGLPVFRHLPSSALGGRIVIAPSLDYIEHAYNHTKYGEYAHSPALEITLPTINDPSLAPEGKHVLSAIIQYVPYALKSGWNDAARSALIGRVIDIIECYAPGIQRLITDAELLTPPDLEREFGLFGGHWHHGDLAFDQFFMVRPLPGAAQYSTPIAGLFLCGAGSHPGGGVMGIAGRNAAGQVLRWAS